jgi:hypothetical protein
MIHHETNIVKPDPGRKSPDCCFYCKRLVGEQHVDDCVMRDRSVMVRVTVDLCMTYPQSFTAEDIEFHLNESSYCCSNIIDDLQRISCICGHTKMEYLGEATEQDEKNWNIQRRIKKQGETDASNN